MSSCKNRVIGGSTAVGRVGDYYILFCLNTDIIVPNKFILEFVKE